MRFIWISRKKLITSSAREIASTIHDYDPYACVTYADPEFDSWNV